MTTREIQAHLQEIYGVEVSPTLVSNVTEAVQDEVRAWRNRPLEPMYPIVYMDALYVRMRDNGHVQNRAVYVAIGVNLEGYKEVLGLWTSANEGAKFWLPFVSVPTPIHTAQRPQQQRIRSWTRSGCGRGHADYGSDRRDRSSRSPNVWTGNSPIRSDSFCRV